MSSTLPFDATFNENPNPRPGAAGIRHLLLGVLRGAQLAIEPRWDADGRPDYSNPTAPRVWEAYIDATGVFKAQGAKPDPWGGTNSFLASIVPDYKQDQKVLFAASKNVLSKIFEASFGNVLLPPIADINGNYVFYEIHLNKPEYDYIVSNTLYSEDGQTAFLAHTRRDDQLPGGIELDESYGAIEVKAAWKQIGPRRRSDEILHRGRHRDRPGAARQRVGSVTLGLVGLHIITLTDSAAEWVWSTFEHVDNAPDAPTTDSQPPPPPAGSHFSFNDSTQKQCAAGFCYQPQNNTPVASPTPTQITRVLNNDLINDPWTQCLNSTMQAELAGTVWANYRLVTTQWPGGSPECRWLTFHPSEPHQHHDGNLHPELEQLHGLPLRGTDGWLAAPKRRPGVGRFQLPAPRRAAHHGHTGHAPQPKAIGRGRPLRSGSSGTSLSRSFAGQRADRGRRAP